MSHPFDKLTLEQLRHRPCMKWQRYPDEVLPLWVADMDFPTAEVIADALSQRAHSGNLGYPMGYMGSGETGLADAIIERQATRHNWHIQEQDLWPINGIIPGLYLASLACAGQSEGVIVQTPAYPPFLSAVQDTGRSLQVNPLRWNGSEWGIDFEGLEALLKPSTRLLMFCNPHNPTGRVFRREELERLAEFVLRHKLWVVSDELHSDLIYAGQQHIPFASLSDEIAQRTITLFGPTKTFNIAGLKVGFAVCQNPDLLERLKALAKGFVGPPNVMAQTATIAAYRHGDAWLQDTLAYLDANRQHIAAFFAQRLPQVKHVSPEGTYLAWFDFNALQLGERLAEVLLEECKVGLNDGRSYGSGGEGFARLNFATSRSVVDEALARIEQGLRPYLD